MKKNYQRLAEIRLSLSRHLLMTETNTASETSDLNSDFALGKMYRRCSCQPHRSIFLRKINYLFSFCRQEPTGEQKNMTYECTSTGAASFRTHTHYSTPTQRSRVLPEKLTVPQLVKKLPAIYETRKFITAFTIARQLSLSYARSIESTRSQPTS